jgi:hypothetical protein
MDTADPTYIMLLNITADFSPSALHSPYGSIITPEPKQGVEGGEKVEGERVCVRAIQLYCNGETGTVNCPALDVPQQRPLFLLRGVLGTREGKAIGSELC